MKEVIVRLWPAQPVPRSYFGLVRRLINVVPQIDAIKWSVCIEGARMAFTHTVHWAKMKVAVIVVEGPPEGKDHHTLERYFDDVLAGAYFIEGQCSKDIIFE